MKIRQENLLQLGRVYKGNLSSYELIDQLKKLSRLFKKHQRIAVWACNGTKYENINRATYDLPDFHYTSEMEERDSGKVEDKIQEILDYLNSDHKYNCWSVEYQGDPRGYTAKLYYRYPRDGEYKEYKGLFIEIN